MATNFSPVGNEQQINLSPNQNNDQSDPDVAVLSDGRFFVAFTDITGGGDTNIIGQFVNSDGTLAGTNIDVEIDIGNQDSAAVAARSSGAAIVVWHDGDASDEIHYSIVSSGGVPGAEQTILDGNAYFRPDVATLADGRSLVVATQDNGNLDLRFRFIDTAGAPLSVPEFIDNGATAQDEAAVAAFGNNALVVYEDRVTVDNVDIQARFFNGTSFTAEVTIADTAGLVRTADVAALTDGRFIVVYTNEANDNIEGRLVSAAGVPLGTAFTVSSTAGFNDDGRVAALPDGGFIVTWETDDPDLGSEVDVGSEGVVARRFDLTGAPAGDAFLVNSGDPQIQENPAVAANASTGQAYIAWRDDHLYGGAGEDNNPSGVRGRAFIATIDTVNGTAGDDSITAFNLGEPINGLSGDDFINGIGGNDIIRGGAGFDHLKGGLGDDQLFGEGGEDLLKGEEGNDLLVGGVGRDVQIGGIGRDVFDFNTIADSRVGANHDFVKGFSHAQHDRINLLTIDADTTAGGNQAFNLIGAAAFSGTAGELRFAGGLLLGDTNGDGIANFEVKVTGLGAAVNGDFVL